MGSKGTFLKAIATEHGMKTKTCSNILNSLVTVGTSEVKKTGIFTIPGLCRIKTRVKPATKACVKNIFGKETKVKAKPAKTVVKAYPVAALRSRSRRAQLGCVWHLLRGHSLWESHGVYCESAMFI